MELEAELDRLHRRLEHDFVSKLELEMITNQQEVAIGRVHEQTIKESETKLSEKIAEINKMLQQQVNNFNINIK